MEFNLHSELALNKELNLLDPLQSKTEAKEKIKLKKGKTIYKDNNFLLLNGIFTKINSKITISMKLTNKVLIYLKVFLNFLSISLNLVSIIIFLIQDAFDNQTYIDTFETIDYSLAYYFLLEVIVLFFSETKKFNFLTNPTNIIDILSIILSLFTRYFEVSFNVSFFRIIRVFKVIRVFRLFKYLETLRMDKEEGSESSYIYTKTTIQKLKTVIYFTIGLFFCIGLLDILEQLYPGNLRNSTNNLDRLYFLIQVAFLVGSPHVQPITQVAKLTVLVMLIIFGFFAGYSFMILRSNFYSDFKKNKFLNLRDHIVIFGYFNETSLLNLLEEFFMVVDVKSQMCVIVLFKTNFDDLSFLTSHLKYNIQFFVYETHNLSFDTLKKVNIVKASAIFSANFNPFSHFNFFDNTFNLLIKTILCEDSVKDKPVFSLYKSSTYKESMLNNQFSITIDVLKTDLIAQSLNNRHLLFFLTSICFKSETSFNLHIVKLPSCANGCFFIDIYKEILRKALQIKDISCPILLGLVQTDENEKINSISYCKYDEICQDSNGIFLSRDEKSITTILNMIDSVVTRTTIDYTKSLHDLDSISSQLNEKLNLGDNFYTHIRARRLPAEKRLGSIDLIDFDFSNHIIILGISTDIYYMTRAIRRYLPKTIIIFADENITINKKILLNQLKMLNSVFVIEYDFFNYTYMEERFQFASAYKIICSFPVLEENINKYLTISKFIEANYGDKSIICFDKQFAKNCIHRTITNKEILEYDSFRHGTVLYSSLLERIFTNSYTNATETTCVIELMKLVKGNSFASLEFFTVRVPGSFVGKTYSEILSFGLNENSLFIPLGITIHMIDKDKIQTEFLINPCPSQMILEDTELLFMEHKTKPKKKESKFTFLKKSNKPEVIEMKSDFFKVIGKEIEKVATLENIKVFSKLLKKKLIQTQNDFLTQ